MCMGVGLCAQATANKQLPMCHCNLIYMLSVQSILVTPVNDKVFHGAVFLHCLLNSVYPAQALGLQSILITSVNDKVFHGAVFLLCLLNSVYPAQALGLQSILITSVNDKVFHGAVFLHCLLNSCLPGTSTLSVSSESCQE